MVKSNAPHKHLQSSPTYRLRSPSSREPACLALALGSRQPTLSDLQNTSATKDIMHGTSVMQSESFTRPCGFDDGRRRLDNEGSGAGMEKGAGAATDINEPECGRQRLQQHWIRVAGNVSIPDSWGREQHLRDWAECSCVEDALHPPGLMLARNALIKD